MLRAIAPSLAFNGLDPAKVKLLGTGLVGRCPPSTREQTLGWRLVRRARARCRRRLHRQIPSRPMARRRRNWPRWPMTRCRWWRCWSHGQPYHRFTQAALMDPNGFAGVNGIFRFNADGTVGARTGDPGSPAGRLPCRQPGAEDVPGAKLLIQQFGDHGVEHQAAVRRGARACRRPECSKPCSISGAIFARHAGACSSALR